MQRRVALKGILSTGIGLLLSACAAPSPGSVSPGSAPSASTAAPAQVAPPATAAASSGRQTTVVYGVSSEVITLNPLLDDSGMTMSATEQIFDSLVKPELATGLPSPALAQSWDVSSDGLQYTFHLRPNVTWSDTRPFTSDDVKFTFDAILDAKTRTPFRSRLSNVDAYDTSDAATFRLKLKTVDCSFLSTSMLLPIVPKHVLVGAADINTDEFGSKRPVGTGPFMLKEWLPQDHMTLVANPNYWQGRPRIDQWIRKITKDSNVLSAQLKTNEVDYGVVNLENLTDLKATGSLNFLPVTTPTNITFIAYNLKNPLFQDKRVRQALTHAVDRKSIVDSLLYGYGQVVDSSILPQNWAYTSNVPVFTYDPDRARALLASAGWTPGSDGIFQKDGRRLAFTIITNSGNKQREAIVTIAQNDWKKVGIEVNSQLIETTAFFARYQQAHEFDAALVGGAGLTIDPDQTPMWSSDQYPNGGNFTGYSSPAADQLLQQGRGLPGCDPDSRKAIYAQFQRVLAEDQPATFVYSTPSIIAFNKRLQNVKVSPWIGRAVDVQSWSVST